MQWTSLGRAGGRRDGGSDLFLCLLQYKCRKEETIGKNLKKKQFSSPLLHHISCDLLVV